MLYSVDRLCLVIVGSLVLVGCGGGDVAKHVAVFKVTGTVTLQGNPLPRAIVTFSPNEGQPVALGMTDDKGEFTLTTYTDGDGAAAGSYNVVVSKAASSGGTTNAGHSTDPALATVSGHDASSSAASGSLIPAAYSDATQTPLNAKVDPKAENKFTFDVKA
jgi:hypothetical protein